MTQIARPGACEVCTAYWVTGVGRFVTLGESPARMAEIWRCRVCGAYWQVGDFDRPKVIRVDDARSALPDLDVIEATLGVDFPQAPPLPPAP